VEVCAKFGGDWSGGLRLKEGHRHKKSVLYVCPSFTHKPLDQSTDPAVPQTPKLKKITGEKTLPYKKCPDG